MNLLKICLFTDVHLPVEGEKAMDVDTYLNFNKVLSEISKENPDHIILAGDVCFRDSILETYSWVKQRLDNLKIPYHVVVGNHDDSNDLHQIIHPDIPFNTISNELYYVKYINQKAFIFLDTGRRVMSEEQWQWLESQLEKGHGMIVMHHPPHYASVPHMDHQYAFQQIDRFMNLVHSQNHEINIFTGHYHVERTIRNKNVTIWITPSCFVQIDDRYEEFRADHHYPCYRNILIDDENGHIITTVKYLY